ncbi:S-crystallin 4-like [Octopus bimaculoides]|uniref:S-crystallin 4-like n=1 Tax=Octopus bimaculoides TaxID=37653 RepID=UPI00071D33A7|nr:S-crystallin 4-like [Octopus bimaculoides]|eukprot:XP_014771131.1 PREDICTED: S-crystallin 4-like [Octopus bimaculoides]
MQEYTLHYFNRRGRAEICRLLFALADIPYIDKRIDFSKWDSMKNKMPCCMLPILEIDRKIQVPQSMTISRYLANEFGFHGSNNIEKAKIESITDCLYDVFDNYMRMFYDRNGRKVKRFSTDMRGKYTENQSESRTNYLETCNRVLPYLENCLQSKESSGQYFTGDKIKLCDLMCYSALENPLIENPALLNDFPKLRNLRQQVTANPKVLSYLKKRNETEC